MPGSSLSNFLLKKIIRYYEKRPPLAGKMRDMVKDVPERVRKSNEGLGKKVGTMIFYFMI